MFILVNVRDLITEKIKSFFFFNIRLSNSFHSGEKNPQRISDSYVMTGQSLVEKSHQYPSVTSRTRWDVVATVVRESHPHITAKTKSVSAFFSGYF